MLYMGLIFALSSWANPPALPGTVSDKDLHGVLYSGLGALLIRALCRGRWPLVTISMVIVAVAASAAYGVSDELHQYFVPGRQMEAADVLADTLGAAVSAVVIWTWAIIQPARSSLRWRQPLGAKGRTPDPRRPPRPDR